MKHLRFLLVIIITSYSLLISNGVIAQTTDSLIVETLRQSNIRFSHDNSVTLLLSGQEKFDDMFQAIRQAKSSIHLDSISATTPLPRSFSTFCARNARRVSRCAPCSTVLATTPTTNP